MSETNAAYRAEAEAMDDALPKATGADAEGMDRFRSRVAAARPAGSPAAATAVTPAATPSVDLTKLDIPILAVNGSFDNPYRKTHRLWREVKTFQNVILPNKTHLTAIAAGAAPDQQYIQVISKFIDSNDR
jgi:pimeloyl-ACP methyl ester carboxylesterase